MISIELKDFVDLSSLNIIALLELKENYKNLNYSIKDIDLQLIKIIYIQYMLLMTVFAALTMFKLKNLLVQHLKFL